jgi:hypothetical protein
MFNDLRFAFFLGTVLLAIGVFGAFGPNQFGAGLVAVAGSILVLAALLGNSINAVREVLEESEAD